MEIKIGNINMDEEQFKRDLRDGMQKAANVAIDNIIRAMFTPKGHWHRKEGIAHQMLREEADDFILSDNFKRILQAALIRNAEASADHAAKKLLNSKARKLLFQDDEAVIAAGE